MSAREPTHKAYGVVKHEGQKDYWIYLGLAYQAEDGKFDLELSSVPMDGKIFCRPLGQDPTVPSLDRVSIDE